MQRLFLICTPWLFLLYIVSCTEKESDEGPSGSNPSTFDCPDNGSPVFMEDSGRVKVDITSIDASETNWNFRTDIADYSGGGFLVWEGESAMGNPGNGLLVYKVHISTPGTYRFLWRSYIAIGNNHTEHNDSWLRIPDAAHFYGKKNNGHIVYPKETELPPLPESSEQSNTTPNGAGADGWFKVYMNTANDWKWQASTSDNDAHNIYAVFTHPGVYTVEVSGRSEGHGIDTFLMYNEDTYTQNEAILGPLSQIACE